MATPPTNKVTPTSPIDTKQMNDDLVGAIYLVVGQGTEGNSASYRMSIAGVTVIQKEKANDLHWGKQERVMADSGYSIGVIQVDLGKRGTWPLGAVQGRPLKEGETTCGCHHHGCIRLCTCQPSAVYERSSKTVLRSAQPWQG